MAEYCILMAYKKYDSLSEKEKNFVSLKRKEKEGLSNEEIENLKKLTIDIYNKDDMSIVCRHINDELYVEFYDGSSLFNKWIPAKEWELCFSSEEKFKEDVDLGEGSIALSIYSRTKVGKAINRISNEILSEKDEIKKHNLNSLSRWLMQYDRNSLLVLDEGLYFK